MEVTVYSGELSFSSICTLKCRAGAVKLNFTFRAKTQFRSMIDVPPLG